MKLIACGSTLAALLVVAWTGSARAEVIEVKIKDSPYLAAQFLLTKDRLSVKYTFCRQWGLGKSGVSHPPARTPLGDAIATKQIDVFMFFGTSVATTLDTYWSRPWPLRPCAKTAKATKALITLNNF